MKKYLFPFCFGFVCGFVFLFSYIERQDEFVIPGKDMKFQRVILDSD